MKKHNFYRGKGLLTYAVVLLTVMGTLLFAGCTNETDSAPSVPEKYKVTVTTTVGGTVNKTSSLPENGIVKANTEIIFTAIPEKNYKIKKWTLNDVEVNGTKTSYTLKITQESRVKVFFEYIGSSPLTQYKVTTSATIGGIIETNPIIPLDGMITENTEITFTATPVKNYKIQKWTLNGIEIHDTAQTYTLKVIGELTICVFFEYIGTEPLSKHKITLIANEHGSATPSIVIPTDGMVEENTKITFTAVPAEGYVVDTWKITGGSFIDNTGTEGNTIAKVKVGHQDMTVTVCFVKAMYAVNYSVDTTNGMHGSLQAVYANDGTPVSAGSVIEYGKTIFLTAIPEEGFEVDHWIVNGLPITGNDMTLYQYIVTQPSNIQVVFKVISLFDKVTITITGDERVDEVASGTVAINPHKSWNEIEARLKAKLTLKAEWKDGDYGIYLWKLGDADGTIIDDTYVFTGNTTVYAVTNYVKFHIEDNVLTRYTGGKPRGSIIIPHNVTEIKGAYPGIFANCTEITDIKLPVNLTIIGTSAFRGCTGLKQLTLPAHLTVINSEAFRGCAGITELDFPISIASIDDTAFYGCTGLTTVNNLPVGTPVFQGCTNLKTVNISKKLSTISNKAFLGCTGLERIDFPEDGSITSIEKNAFRGCTGLTTVNNLPVNTLALQECISLKTVSFSKKLTTIDTETFRGCKGLKTIIFPKDASLTAIDGTDFEHGAFRDCTALEHIKNLSVSNTLAFKGAKSLKKVSFSNNVTVIGDKIFFFCSSLTTIHLPQKLMTIGEDSFAGCPLTSINFNECMNLTHIGARSFSGYYDSTVLDLSNNTKLTSIGNQAFWACSKIIQVILPASVTEIGERAFDRCSELNYVIIKSNTLSLMGKNAFKSIKERCNFRVKKGSGVKDALMVKCGARYEYWVIREEDHL
mgnify:CR=1 FL=1